MIDGEKSTEKNDFRSLFRYIKENNNNNKLHIQRWVAFFHKCDLQRAQTKNYVKNYENTSKFVCICPPLSWKTVP